MARNEAGRNKLADGWLKKIRPKLEGRTIKQVRYLTADECSGLGWPSGAVVLVLDNGEQLWPSADDEGNGPGALFTTIKGLETIPVI